MSTLIKKRLLFILTCLAGVSPSLKAQHILDNYIQQAFTRNQGLQQQQLQLDKSLYALQEARSYFLPHVSLLANYNKADGGRTIDIPVGDMLNPVYTTLNQLTNSQRFPQLNNVSEQLNPDNFYDAKFRTSLPLINTEIWYARKMRQENISLAQAGVNVYKRALVRDIKAAYYQYYQAIQAVQIYQQSMQLVQENIRVNTSLLRNGVRNNTALTRSQTEQQKISASIIQAENQQRKAQAYFNFLLNRALTDSIAVDSSVFQQLPAGTVDGTAAGISNREELVQLKQREKLALLQQQAFRSSFVPKLSTFVDLGSQAFNWRFDNRSRYYLFGLTLEWDLFNGGRRKQQINQAATDISAVRAQMDLTQQSISLELLNADNDQRTAVANYESAETQLQLAEKYYRDQLKVYKEGQLLYLELLDAQQQLTTARIQRSLAFAQVLTAQANIERAQASYSLNITTSH